MKRCCLIIRGARNCLIGKQKVVFSKGVLRLFVRLFKKQKVIILSKKVVYLSSKEEREVVVCGKKMCASMRNIYLQASHAQESEI